MNRRDPLRELRRRAGWRLSGRALQRRLAAGAVEAVDPAPPPAPPPLAAPSADVARLQREIERLNRQLEEYRDDLAAARAGTEADKLRDLLATSRRDAALWRARAQRLT